MNGLLKAAGLTIGTFVVALVIQGLLYQYTPLSATTGGIIVWGLIGLGGVIYIFKNVDLTKLFQATLGPLALVGALLLIGWMLKSGSQARVRNVAVTTWDQAMVRIGREGMPKPEGEGAESRIIETISDTIPDDFQPMDGRPGKEECLDAQTKALWVNDLEVFLTERARCESAYDLYRRNQWTSLLAVKGQTVALAIGLRLLAAMVGAIWAYTIKGVGKITLTLPIGLVLGWIVVALYVPESAQEAATGIIGTAVTIYFIELLFAVGGFIWLPVGDEWNERVKNRGFFEKWPAKLFIAMIGGFLAIGLDSMFQHAVISGAIISGNGHLSGDMAGLLWQIGALGGSFFGAMFGQGLRLARAGYEMSRL